MLGILPEEWFQPIFFQSVTLRCKQQLDMPGLCPCSVSSGGHLNGYLLAITVAPAMGFKEDWIFLFQ